MTSDPTNADVPATAAAGPPRGRRWVMVAVNVLLVIAIIALLVATWMPAIYDRLATTKPSQ